MARIRFIDRTPPGGWRYVQPETAMEFDSDNFRSLCEQVVAHRQYKGIPSETVEADIEQQICAGAGLEWCRPDPGEDYRPVNDLTHQLTTDLALSAVRAVGQFLREGGEVVSKEVAASRAATCRGCPFNKPSKFCACSSVYTVVEALVPKGRRESGISVCMACGCSLIAKVNLPDTVIAASLSPGLALPPWCWQEKSRKALEAS